MLLLALGLHGSTDLVGTLERRFYDGAMGLHDAKPSDRIAVIAIDDRSVANIGKSVL